MSPKNNVNDKNSLTYQIEHKVGSGYQLQILATLI